MFDAPGGGQVFWVGCALTHTLVPQAPGPDKWPFSREIGWFGWGRDSTLAPSLPPPRVVKNRDINCQCGHFCRRVAGESSLWRVGVPQAA